MKSSLNVLFLCGWYPSRVLPSNGDFIQRHAEAVALRHHVTVFHIISDKNSNKLIEITDNTINNIRTLIAYVKYSKNPIIKINNYIKASKLLFAKIDVFDIVHVNKFFPLGLIAYRLKKRKKTPYIISEHHSLYHKPNNKSIGVIEKRLSKIIVKNAGYVCPVSDDLGNAMKKFGLKGNYFSVPNVVDTTVFTPKKERNNNIFTLLHVSSMVKIKNIEGILKVVKILESKIPKFHFNFIGGNAEDFIENAKKLDINLKNVTFINQVPHKELVNYFQNANAFVLFSYSENLPCVILESFSCGTPVISSNVGGISEYFPKDFGLLIPSNNKKELTNAIVKLYSDFNQISSDKMHQYVEDNFSKEQICKKFSKLYDKILIK